MYCTATLNGQKVYVELTTAQLYSNENPEVDIFLDFGGELVCLNVGLDELQEIKEEDA